MKKTPLKAHSGRIKFVSEAFIERMKKRRFPKTKVDREALKNWQDNLRPEK